jgi:hypothetical protein
LKVVFSEFASENSDEGIASALRFPAGWQPQAFDASADFIFVLNREIIDIWQRNANAGFSLLRRLTEAKNAAQIGELQAAHLRNQLDALAGQMQELTVISVSATSNFFQRFFG